MKKTALLFIMGAGILFPLAFWADSFSQSQALGLYIYNTGRLWALAGFLLLLYQYILSSKIKWLERGIGLDRLFIIHRTCGAAALVLIILHPVFIFVSMPLQGFGLPITPLVAVGVNAAVILAVTAGAALLYRALRLKYETWKNIHRASYVLLPLVFFHSFFLGSSTRVQPIRSYWLFLGALFLYVLIHRTLAWLHIRKHSFFVSEVKQETSDTWSVFFKGRQISYKPGQFMIVRLIRNRKVSEPHPFTISSSPAREALSITVKSVGDFTSAIGKTTILDRAYIDAPYGIFSFLNYNAPVLVFISGGIGITPFMSMLRYMRDRKMERRVLLIWGNKTEADITFRKELDQIALEMPLLKVVHVMSSQESWQGEKGLVNTELLRKYISGSTPALPRAAAPHTAVPHAEAQYTSAQYFLCGPPPMMNGVLRSLKQLGIPKSRVHDERFSLR